MLWNYVKECGGAIMARIGFRHPEAVKRQSKAQKWFVFNFWSSAVHRHQKQYCMNYIFCITSCWKMEAKNGDFQSKIGQNLKVLDG